MPITNELLDELLKDCERPEDLLGDAGLMKELKIRLMGRMLGAELTAHLGYEASSEPPPGQTNRRNGSGGERLKGQDVEVPISVPRDRDGSFEPVLDVSFQQVVHPIRTEEAGVARLQKPREDRINSHKNARLTALGRAELVHRVVELGQPVSQVAAAFGVSVKTVRKWVARFEAEGVAGLRDRPSRPHKLYRPTPDEVVDRIAALRRKRWTGKHIAAALGVSPATVSRVLRRLGLSRMRDLEPPEPVRRYERARPGEMIHIDIKKLGRFERVGHRITGDRRGQSNSRGVGWEYVHVCVDDHSRIAFTSIYSDEKAVSAIAFLRDAIRYYAGLGVTVERVMSDNGSCYKSFAFRDACKALGLRHIRTKPYTPKTNGKAERFIKTALNEWAYAHIYQTSDQRAAHLPEWTHTYNWHRPHGGIGSKRPISRLGMNGDNLLRLHI
jgi:transposase InsO family protein